MVMSLTEKQIPAHAGAVDLITQPRSRGFAEILNPENSHEAPATVLPSGSGENKKCSLTHPLCTKGFSWKNPNTLSQGLSNKSCQWSSSCRPETGLDQNNKAV
jgi:hypothetical protein